MSHKKIISNKLINTFFKIIYMIFTVNNPSTPWFSCLSSERSRTSSWSLWCRRACRCRRARAGRASWWMGSPSRCAPPPPSAACRTTPACHRGSSAHQRHMPPPGRKERERERKELWGKVDDAQVYHISPFDAGLILNCLLSRNVTREATFCVGHLKCKCKVWMFVLRIYIQQAQYNL